MNVHYGGESSIISRAGTPGRGTKCSVYLHANRTPGNLFLLLGKCAVLTGNVSVPFEGR